MGNEIIRTKLREKAATIATRPPWSVSLMISIGAVMSDELVL
jgi:hypothetical protein